MTDRAAASDVPGTDPPIGASDGRIVDFISHTRILATPEEVEATQPFSCQLVEDYGYPAERIQTRPQFRVKKNPSDQRGYPVDIAVFNDDAKHRDDVYMIIECKRDGTDPEEGDNRQLFIYMTLSSAELGVWTDGSVRQFFRKVTTPTGITFEQIPSLPRFGETVNSIGKYLRKNLARPINLSTTFRALRNHLAVNAVGTTRDEALATQLINIVFCKIYDERFTAQDDRVAFRYEIGEEPTVVAKRITDLFEKVKGKYPEVFDTSDVISIDDGALAHVVGELQPFALTEADRDAVGQAFEVFIAATLKGGQGQFFTPRNVVRLMVELVDPQPFDLVIDPACGPGGFLIESLRHKWDRVDKDAAQLGWTEAATAEERQSVAIKSIFGIEKDAFLAKVAKAYMAIMGDGKGGIFCQDSLDRPETWPAEVKREIVPGRFDIVLANPPFGKGLWVKGDDKLAQFELGHKYQLKGKIKTKTASVLDKSNPQLLFLERCIQLASDGGRVAIILPETFFHAPTAIHVRAFMRTHNVQALVDLPHNTFRPFNNAKCIAVVLQKNTPQQTNIRMVAAEEMGNDHKGATIFRYDETTHDVTDKVWDDLTIAIDELRAGRNGDYVFEAPSEDVLTADIFIPRYYWGRLNENLEPPPRVIVEWKTLGEFENDGLLEINSGHGSPKSIHKGRGEYPYIRVKDIVNWEIYRDPNSGMPKPVFDKFTKRRPLRSEDVVYVQRGSYRIGDVAIASPVDSEVILTREIHTFRVLNPSDDGLNPYYLLYLLTSPQVAQQTRAKIFIDTTLPTIGTRYRDIKLPWATDPEIRADLTRQVRDAVQARWTAMSNIRHLIAEIKPDNAGRDSALDAELDDVDSADTEDETASHHS